MLDFFRQKGLTSVVYGAIIIATVLVFVLQFNPSAGKRLGSLGDVCAARVRGTCIEPKAHIAAYRIFSSAAARHGNPINEMQQESASRFVLEGLVERELLLGEAERLGLTVSDDEVMDSILRGDILISLPSDNVSSARDVGLESGRINVDQLSANGYKNKDTKQFDEKVYDRVLRQLLNRSRMEFREWQRRELLAAKVRDLIKAPVRVADDEAFDRYGEERSTSTVNHVIVRKGWVEKYGISEGGKDFDDWVKANADKVVVPVRHILIRAEKDKADKLEEAKKKAQGVLDRIKKGEDFAKLAKELSDDPGSKDKGGQYPGEMVKQFVPEFQKSVEGLKPGQVDPNLVETSFGFHIIKRDPATKEDIAKAYKASKSDELAKAIASEIAADLKGGKPANDALAAVIAKYGKYAPKVEKPAVDPTKDAGAAPAPETFTAATDPQRPQLLTSSAFNRGGNPIPAISPDATAAIVKLAFEAQANDVAPEPIATDDGFIVVQVKERKPATREDFDKERDTYVVSLLTTKKEEALGYYARRLREGSKQEVKVDESKLFGHKSDAGAQPAEEE